MRHALAIGFVFECPANRHLTEDPINPLGPNNHLHHAEERSLDKWKINHLQKVFTHVSLCELPRLTWVESF